MFFLKIWSSLYMYASRPALHVYFSTLIFEFTFLFIYPYNITIIAPTAINLSHHSPYFKSHFGNVISDIYI